MRKRMYANGELKRVTREPDLSAPKCACPRRMTPGIRQQQAHDERTSPYATISLALRRTMAVSSLLLAAALAVVAAVQQSARTCTHAWIRLNVCVRCPLSTTRVRVGCKYGVKVGAVVGRWEGSSYLKVK